MSKQRKLYLVIRKPCEKNHCCLTGRNIIFFTLLMSALTFIIRIWFPIDQWVDLFGVIGIEPAHFPQYFLLFIAGTIAYQNDWLNQITEKIGRCCTVLGLCLCALIYLQFVMPHQVINSIFNIFSLYESIMSVTILIGLIYITKKYLNRQNNIVNYLSKNAFFFYIIHNLYVVSLQVFFCSISLNVFLKVILISISTIALCVVSSLPHEKPNW